MSLYDHVKHEHTPKDINAAHAPRSFNQRIALQLTTTFQKMPTFWIILAWILLWIAANATITHFDPLPWPLLLALASVPQLPLMIVILVGQGLIGNKQETQADEQYKTTMRIYHDMEQVARHLDAQDQLLALIGDVQMSEHATAERLPVNCADRNKSGRAPLLAEIGYHKGLGGVFLWCKSCHASHFMSVDQISETLARVQNKTEDASSLHS